MLMKVMTSRMEEDEAQDGEDEDEHKDDHDDVVVYVCTCK